MGAGCPDIYYGYWIVLPDISCVKSWVAVDMANERLDLDSRRVPLEQHDYYDAGPIEAREDDYAPRIGKFFIAFSELENTLDSCISTIISERSDDLGLQVVSVMDFSQKV